MSIVKLLEKAKNGDKISCITSYNGLFSSITSKIIDIILIGDSHSMVLNNNQTTIQTTIEDIIYHAKSVMSGVKNKTVTIADMPFGYFERNKEFALDNAVKIIKQTGVNGVKIEGGVEIAETIKYIIERGIPVMAHIGLMPQKINNIGSFKKMNNMENIINDFKAIAKSGAFSVVIENINEDIVEEINKIKKECQSNIITISIGSGKKCNGEVAVLEDICGLTEKSPPFTKRYKELRNEIEDCIRNYINDF